MKVIYKKTIMEQIIDAKVEANRQNKEIEKIVLAVSEYNRLCREQGLSVHSQTTHVCGVRVERRQVSIRNLCDEITRGDF